MEYVYSHSGQQEKPEPEEAPEPYLKQSAIFMFGLFVLGIHRFYVGKTFTGLLQFLLSGLYYTFAFDWMSEPFELYSFSGILVLLFWGWVFLDFILIFYWKIDVSTLPWPISHRNKSTTLLWWKLGLHRIYAGKIGTGFLYFFTLGGLGIWAIIDLLMISNNDFKDKRGVFICPK